MRRSTLALVGLSARALGMLLFGVLCHHWHWLHWLVVHHVSGDMCYGGIVDRLHILLWPSSTAKARSLKEAMQQLSLVVAKLEGGERPEDEVAKFVKQLAELVAKRQVKQPTRDELQDGLMQIINEVSKTPC